MSDGYFKFNDKTVAFRRGQSLAAALTEAGIFAFRHTPKGEERGLFCGMGICQDTPLPDIWTYGRLVRFADGPDEVHMSQLAKLTIKQVMES